MKSILSKKQAKARRDSASKANDPHEAIRLLKSTIELQEKREEHLRRLRASTIKEGKQKLAERDRKGALFAVQRKKMFESEIEKIRNVRMTMETQIIHLESAVHNKLTVNAMAEGTKAMANVQALTGIADVEDVVEQWREDTTVSDDVNVSVSQWSASLIDEDDDELLQELNDLIELDETTTHEVEQGDALPTRLELPAAPNAKLPAVEAEKDKKDIQELKTRLASLMS